MMEKVELKNADVLREIVKTNRSNMPERINILSLKINVDKNKHVYLTSRVISPTPNNELFYLDKSVQDKTFVRTLRRNNKPYVIEGVVERFSEAYIEIVIPKDYSDIHVNGVFKHGQEFYVPSMTKDDIYIHLASGKEYRDLPLDKCIHYNVHNGHCSAIASASDAKKLKLSLYATYGVSNFNNAEWSKNVHCGMYEELLRELLK